MRMSSSEPTKDSSCPFPRIAQALLVIEAAGTKEIRSFPINEHFGIGNDHSDLRAVWRATLLYGSGGEGRTRSGESLALSNIQGIGGSILPMSSHGLVSSALFLCVGVLYDRHKTRLDLLDIMEVQWAPCRISLPFSYLPLWPIWVYLVLAALSGNFSS